jgi:Right handed beta helix region
MRFSCSLSFCCLALIVLAAFSGQALAGSTAAGLCAAPGTHYTTIQAAVTAAEALTPPNTVRVCPGSYTEQVLITGSLTLEGVPSTPPTQDAAVILPPAPGLATNGNDIFGNPAAAQIFIKGPGITVTISNLTVDGTGNNIAGCGAATLEGIYFQNASGKITKSTVRNQFQTDFADYGGCQNGLAINVENADGSSNVTVSNNSVRSYQKNGITATGASTGPGSSGPTVTISGNYIVGLGAAPMNWPGGAAENGVQIGFGASGTVSGNTVNDNIWWGEYPQFNYAGLGGPTSGNAASGILVYSSDGITITGNNVGSAQFGIVTVTDPSDSTYCNGGPCGPADSTIITSNKVSGTQVFDAIDICSSSNTVKSNTIYGSAESAIHVDESCGSGNYNSVTNNTINEACAGILEGNNTGTYSPNTFSNVSYTTLAGDSCTAPMASVTKATASKRSVTRSSPYKPNRK